MSQPERIRDILKRPEYQKLKSTPDLSAPPAPMSREELDEAKALFEYEQQLQDQKRGQH